MSKITIHKKVFWFAGGRQLEGKVKQILSDHAVVTAEGSDYLVRKASLSVSPSIKSASASKTIIIASNL